MSKKTITTHRISGDHIPEVFCPLHPVHSSVNATVNLGSSAATIGQREIFRIRFIGGTDSILVRPMFEACVREYPHKIWPEIWYSTSNESDPGIPIELGFAMICGFHQHR